MSRNSRIDRHALQDTHPRHRLAERQRAPDEVCRDVLIELEQLPKTSTRDRLILDVRALRVTWAKLVRDDAEARRTDAEALFRRQR